MVNDMSYNVISHVLDSWEKLRQIKNYEEVAGILLFQRLFEKCPEAKVLFGFPIDVDPSSSTRFVMHASYLIQMIDTALNMLGPDIELLTEMMQELGVKHVRYGVKPEMFPIMGECLIHTLKSTLKEDVMNASVVDAWKETYAALSGDMIHAQITTKSSH